MHPDRIAGVSFPDWYEGIKVNHRGYPKRPVTCLAFDTETVDGWPYTLQLSGPDGTTLQYLKPSQFLRVFVRWIRRYVEAHGHSNVVVWGHVLAFDLPALLYPKAKLFATEEPFTVECDGCTLTVVYGRVCFAHLRIGNRTVPIVDTFAYVWTSLKRAAVAWELPYQKLPRPQGLGRRVLRGPRFDAYAKRDAEVTRLLGEKLLGMHRQYDVRVSVSAAQFAARLFTHAFLTKPLPRPPADVETLAMLSYHGGKNGYYLPGPQWVHRCREYDLRSAYPWAMTKMPDLESRGKWKRVRSVHPTAEGFYRVWGEVRPDRYPLLYDEGFHPAKGEIAGMAFTSMEVREAWKTGELVPRRVEGWVWVSARAQAGHRSQDGRGTWALPRYAQHFFDKKEAAAPGPDREFYKLLLNSLYGKFINLIPDGQGGERPGGYFFPVLASWITATVRIRVHALEHETRAVHTATDAVHTRQTLRAVAGLGGVEEAQRGPCFFLRNKVYFHYAEDGSSVKLARHGIRVPPRRLWAMLLKGKGSYTITHLLKPKEAVALGTRPLQPVTRRLTVHGLNQTVRPIPNAATLYWRGAVAR